MTVEAQEIMRQMHELAGQYPGQDAAYCAMSADVQQVLSRQSGFEAALAKYMGMRVKTDHALEPGEIQLLNADGEVLTSGFIETGE